MRILMVSTDRKIFEDGSSAQLRMIKYGRMFDELHIVVFAKRHSQLISLHDQQLGIKSAQQTSGYKIPYTNVFIYSTASMSKLSYVFDGMRIGKRIIKNSQNNDFYITCQDPFETGLTGWLIAIKFKIKLQLQVHTDFLDPSFVRVHLLNELRVYIAKFLLPKADCIRVVSKRIADSIAVKLKLKPSKISILPIFVNIEKIKKAPVIVDLHEKYAQFEKIILMVGRLEKEKNISTALLAMKELLKKYPKVGLVIVGDGSNRESLNIQINTFKIQNSVVLDGWQNNDTVMSYYKTAELLLVTSDYEGYGMVVIEALVSGLPVLSTDVGIAKDVGAEITKRDYVAKNIVKYIEGEKVIGELKDYPYQNEQDYLEQWRKTVICDF